MIKTDIYRFFLIHNKRLVELNSFKSVYDPTNRRWPIYVLSFRPDDTDQFLIAYGLFKKVQI